MRDTESVVDALGECIEELRDIRAWAVTENSPLRRQEVDSIDEVIEKANAALAAAPAAQPNADDDDALNDVRGTHGQDS